MAFLLFLLTNAALFIRPSELFPELQDSSPYLYLISASMLAGLPAILRHLRPASLRDNPTTLFVLAIAPAIVLSHEPDLWLWSSQTNAFAFIKVFAYYLVLVSLVDSRRKLTLFLVFLGLLIACSALLALLDRAGHVSIASLESVQQRELDPVTGEIIAYPRLRSTGIFNDPNDFAMILVIGFLILLFFLFGQESSYLRLLWLFPLLACGGALWLTKSRGGLLAMFAALTALSYVRWGWKRSLGVCVVVLPVVAAGFAGRGEAMESGTGQQRVQLWSDGLMLLRSHPVFGIGYGMYEEEMGLAAHNSYVHTYTELGLVGGTLFFGVYAINFWALFLLSRDANVSTYAADRWLLALLTALLVASATSQLSISRAYTVSPYIAVGLVAAYARNSRQSAAVALPRFDLRMLAAVGFASVSFLLTLYLYVRFAARWA